MRTPHTLRIDGALYLRTERGNVDPFLLKLLELAERDGHSPVPFEQLVQQYQQTHDDLTDDDIHARLTELQLAGLVTRHARGPGGQLGGRTNWEEYSLTGKGRGFLRA